MTRHLTAPEKAELRFLAAEGVASIRVLGALFGVTERGARAVLARGGIVFAAGSQEVALRAAWEADTGKPSSDLEWRVASYAAQAAALRRLRQIPAAEAVLGERAAEIGSAFTTIREALTCQ